ncbi:MAG: hypothetical protein M1455_03125 [Actinobacteria bacterium]|nr:hypothetical protein [Actinomycetota bacterium]
MIVSRLSTSATGGQGNDSSNADSISTDGRYVAFHSHASNLTPDDPDTTADVFVKDTQTGAISLVSKSTLGAKGDGDSGGAAVSADGRYVAFFSYATNLSTADQDFVADVFLRDTQLGITTLVSSSTDGAVKGNSNSVRPSISADGRYVAFESDATNLVPLDNNNDTDVFRKDTQTHETRRVSLASNGNQVVDDSFEPSISADGNLVAFSSQSGMGTGDPDAIIDIFLKNMQTREVTLESTSPAGVKGNAASSAPAISANGRYVAFHSDADNLVAGDNNDARDVFRKDTESGATTRISISSSGSEATGASEDASISDNGRYVAFESGADNLSDSDGNGNFDIYSKDTVTGATDLISLRYDGGAAAGSSGEPAVSADGSYVAFHSSSNNMVPGDSNNEDDVFINHSGRRCGFTWYDDLYAANWILFARPAGGGDAWFDVSIAGIARPMPSLPGISPGQVTPGNVLYTRYSGVIGGPVDAGYHSRYSALVSQRILWAGNSLEEVVGTDTQKFSNHFYWTWYDEVSAGYKNWVLVSNPSANPIYYRIRIEGSTKSSGQIAAGASVTPRFPGVMGGPVEVEAWSDGVGGAIPAYVAASQRVLINGDTSFNEVPGIPAGELSSDYYWTWYDMQSAGAANWVLISNRPGAPAIYFRIKIGQDTGDDIVVDGGPIGPGDTKTLTFENVMGGPVEIHTFSDAQHNHPATSIASQRVLWGPSFEEVPGIPSTALAPDYHWTWYDMQSSGAANWVLIANPPGGSAIGYTIRIGSQTYSGGPIMPGGSYTRQFPGEMDGPVEVATVKWNSFPVESAPSISSQRVLWNGFFNEVPGKSP